MEYNWADPKKNKRVDSVMMAKVEASRVKRLSSIKSTVSNQLHPAAEHKLKVKKKKASDADARPSSRLHQREFNGDNNNNHSSGSSGSSGSGNGSSSGSDGRNPSFYNEFLPQAAKPASVFDGFDVHAAAGGLFHPASNIQAFAEHDAKYAAARDKSSARSSSSHSSSSSSSSGGGTLERRLPPLSGNSDRSERLASRSDSRLPTASSSASASSITSHRSLLGSRAGNRSDSDLHAPRRIGIVPSSADRNAMDLLSEMDEDDDMDDLRRRHHHHQSQSQQQDENHEQEDEEEEPQVPSPLPLKNLMTTTAKRVDDNNSKSSLSQLPLELDLSQKFEQLKRMMKPPHRENKEDPTGSSKTGPQILVEQYRSEHKATTKATPAAAVKKSEDDASQPKIKKVAKPKAATGAMTSERKDVSAKYHAPQVAAVAEGGSNSGSGAGVLKKPKSTAHSSELKTRNGVSLTDLKHEHRAALAMLQELGGPIDTDYQDQHDAETQKKTKTKTSAPVVVKVRNDKTTSDAKTTTSSSSTHSNKTSNKTVVAPASDRPTGSADRSARLVDKLRSQIPSERDKSHKDCASEPSELQGKELVSAALDAARLALEKETSSGRLVSQAKKTLGGEEDELLWTRYAGDENDDDDDDNEDKDGPEQDEEDRSAELYDDEYFEG